MTFRFAQAERACRNDPRTTLKRRNDALLPFVGSHTEAGGGLLLDACVYIDRLQGKIPLAVERLLAVRTVNHSAVAVQELMHTVGVLDPRDPRTPGVVARIGQVVDGMRPHRLFTPHLDVLATAAVYAGMLSRTQGHARGNRMSVLQDCVLFLQAMKLGFTVLTRNVGDFDHLLQMRPAGRVLFYRL